jgi:tRNA wybutosine-synthesizing protein 2
VQKKDALEAIREISSLGLLDGQRKVLARDDLLEVPVRGDVPGRPAFLQESPQFYNKSPSLSELLEEELSQKELELLPRGWAILGSVIVVKIPGELEAHKQQIGSALLRIYPRCRSVLRDFGISGHLREPLREIVAGSGSETIHIENGVSFKLDAMKVMFSPGNLLERTRMSRLGSGEVVVDMFAGIGYFSLPMAVHSRPREVISIELNPVAYSYLVENARLNRVQDIVEPVLGDCARVTPSGIADRVVMGYVGSTDRYLLKGVEALKPGGVLHYHQTIPSWLYPQALVDDISKAASFMDRKAKVMRCVRVKRYSPGVVHAVLDACIE